MSRQLHEGGYRSGDALIKSYFEHHKFPPATITDDAGFSRTSIYATADLPLAGDCGNRRRSDLSARHRRWLYVAVLGSVATHGLILTALFIGFWPSTVPEHTVTVEFVSAPPAPPVEVNAQSRSTVVAPATNATEAVAPETAAPVAAPVEPSPPDPTPIALAPDPVPDAPQPDATSEAPPPDPPPSDTASEPPQPEPSTAIQPAPLLPTSVAPPNSPLPAPSVQADIEPLAPSPQIIQVVPSVPDVVTPVEPKRTRPPSHHTNPRPAVAKATAGQPPGEAEPKNINSAVAAAPGSAGDVGSNRQAEDRLRDQIRDAVQAAARCPAVASMMHQSGTASIAFDYRDGAVIGGGQLVQSTGVRSLDAAAMTAVRDAHYPKASPAAATQTLHLLIRVDEACNG